MVFDDRGHAVSLARREHAQHYPAAGWVEHDAEEIWRDALATAREALARAGLGAHDMAAIGITNQRETTVIWERATGKPIHRAIVWQDRRTADACTRLQADGAADLVRRRTGLLLDPYFSGTKIAWLLDNVPGARARAEQGELAFGTMDCFLLWRLTGGRVHATDVTNASRTLLFDIHRGDWDGELLNLLGVPRALLPEIRDSSGVFGATESALLGGSLPVAGIAGDQQAALFGQACFEPGMAKATYGTGCFLLLNTGTTPVESRNKLLTTPACRIAGRTTYAMEGSIFVAGAAVKWLRDGLGVIREAAETEALARQVPDSHGVHLVPAFVGLGAPHWRARGTRDHLGAHVRYVRGPSCARSARVRRFPDARPGRDDGRRRHGPRRLDPRGRRHGHQQLVLPVPRGRAGCARRAAGRGRDHGSRCRLARGARDRGVEDSRRSRRHLGKRRDLPADDGCGTPQRAARRLAGRVAPSPPT